MRGSESDIVSALPADLDSLPVREGFRLRGIETTRLETFVDAAFAFAITILVIAVGQPPDDISSLLTAFRNVPAFVASALIMSIFWRGHWLWSRRFGLEDGRSILLSWFLVITVLIYVYPLRSLFGSMFYYVSSGSLGHPFYAHTMVEMRGLFISYSAGLMAISICILLLNWNAWAMRDALKLNELERSRTRAEIGGWLIPVCVGALSILIALIASPRWIDYSGWIYFLILLLVPIYRQIVRARRRRQNLAR